MPGDDLQTSVKLSNDNDGKLVREQIERIKVNKEVLLVYGILRYQDVFGSEHKTAFGFTSNFSPSHMGDGLPYWYLGSTELPNLYNTMT